MKLVNLALFLLLVASCKTAPPADPKREGNCPATRLAQATNGPTITQVVASGHLPLLDFTGTEGKPTLVKVGNTEELALRFNVGGAQLVLGFDFVNSFQQNVADQGIAEFDRLAHVDTLKVFGCAADDLEGWAFDRAADRASIWRDPQLKRQYDFRAQFREEPGDATSPLSWYIVGNFKAE